VNVNFPPEPRGIRWTRQSVRHYDGKVVPGQDPRGRAHFWITTAPIEAPEEDTDRWAVEHGWIALTPLRLDLTDHAALATAACPDRADLSPRPAAAPTDRRT
jgi:5'-nucleotidase